MQRYFITKEEFESNIIVSNDVFHISKVMRAKIDDNLIICYKKAYLVKITEITNDKVKFEILNELEENPELKTKITLLQGLPKGDKLDDIIKHSTELGVAEVILFQMKRSIVKFDEKKVSHKLLRYSKIAKEAAEQSHRVVIPNIVYTDIKKIDYSKYDLLIVLDEDEAKKVKSNTLKEVYQNQKNILFVVGPEGGIDNLEREFFLKNNFKLVSLGNRILRTETASLSFLSMMNYIEE